MELFYAPAIQRPGPEGKFWPAENAVNGIIEHSMQGSLMGAWTVLDNPNAASWQFSIAKDGVVYQHYPLNASCWHAGSKAQNERLIGVEHEGGPPLNLSEPFTEPQVASSVALSQWIAEQGGFTLSRNPAGQTLFEHRDVHNTLCPSGRVPWERYFPPAIPVGPNVAFSYRGWNAATGKFEYQLDIAQHWDGETVGPNVGTVYEGYDPQTWIHRYRFEVAKHWEG